VVGIVCWIGAVDRCASTQICTPGDALPDNEAACPASSWRYNACEADDAISISRLALGAGTMLKAGLTKLLEWDGGRADSQGGTVSLALRKDNGEMLLSGYGLPPGPIPNTGSFQWRVEPGIQSSGNYQLMIVDEFDSSHFQLSPSFAVDGDIDEGYYWVSGAWSICSEHCGSRGRMTRTVICKKFPSRQTVPASKCNNQAKPVTSSDCNKFDCPDSCESCGCVLQPDGRGQFCGRWNQALTGCDTRGGGGDGASHECCRRQGLECDDGCTGKAEWVESSRGQCNMPCNGGTQRVTFHCIGSYGASGCDRLRNSDCDNPLKCLEKFCGGYASSPTGMVDTHL
jgi:hypothetical protein